MNNKCIPSIRRRMASMAYEFLLLLGVLTLTLIVPHLIIGIIWHIVFSGKVLWLHVFWVLFAYFGWLWRKNGQTLAMQTWKLKLESITGGRLSWLQIVIRYVLVWPSVGLFGVGLIWALFDRQRQFLHDRLAGTRIVLA